MTNPQADTPKNPTVRAVSSFPDAHAYGCPENGSRRDAAESAPSGYGRQASRAGAEQERQEPQYGSPKYGPPQCPPPPEYWPPPQTVPQQYGIPQYGGAEYESTQYPPAQYPAQYRPAPYPSAPPPSAQNAPAQYETTLYQAPPPGPAWYGQAPTDFAGYTPAPPVQQPAVVPGGPLTGPRAPVKPSSYWPLTIAATLFSLVIGGVALYFSSQVGPRWDRGDTEGSAKASTMALAWGIAGLVIGLIWTIGVFSA